MGFVADILASASYGQRTDLENPALWLLDALGGGSTTRAGERVSPSSAMRLPTVLACIRNIAEDVAKLPVEERQKRPERRGSDAVADGAAGTVLDGEFNPYVLSYTGREAMTGWAIGWGRAYAEIERNGAGGRPVLWPIHPSRARLVWIEGDLYLEVHQNDLGAAMGVVRIPYADVLHIRGFGDEIEGYGLVQMAAESIGVGLAAQSFAATFFGNGAHAGGVITWPATVAAPEEKAIRKIKKQWAKLKGRHANEPMTLLDGATWTQTTVPPEHAQFLETRKFQTVEFCRITRMPLHMVQDLDRGTFCLPAGTMVFAVDGPRPIETVRSGTEVWSYDGSALVRAKVEAASCSGVDDILRIEARGAVLRCSPGHRVLVRRETLEPFAGGRGQTVERDGRKWRRGWEETYVRADEILPGDRLVAPRSLPVDGGTRTPTREATVGFCETVGHHLGDGFTFRSRGYPAGLGFSHGEDESSREHYAGLLASVFPMRTDVYSRDAVLDNRPVARRRDANTTVLNSGAALREIEACGLGGKALEKSLPGWAFGLRHDLRLAILRGYLDSDGTVSKAGQARFASGNRALLEGMRHLAISCGLRPGRVYEAECADEFSRGGSHTLYSFGIARPDDVARLGSHRAEHLARAEAAVRARRPRRGAVYPGERRKRGLDMETVRYMSVVRVVREPPEPVYDLSVSGTHSFVADGVLVHNSNIEHLRIEYVQDCLGAWITRWEKEAERKLLTAAERSRGRYVKHNVNAMLRGDFASRAAGFRTLISSMVLTPNEARDFEDYNPSDHPGADELWTQGAMVPMRLAAEGRTTTTAPAPVGQQPAGATSPEPVDATEATVAEAATFRPFLALSATRLVRKEAMATARAAKRLPVQRDYALWGRRFVAEHREDMAEEFRPYLLARDNSRADLGPVLDAWQHRFEARAGAEFAIEDESAALVADVEKAVEEAR